MPNLYMMVGLPGSGKSNLIKNSTTQQNNIILSSDELRIELFGEEYSPDHNEEVFNVLHKRLISRLEEKKDVYYDATNISKKRRIELLRRIKKIECKKICIVMATPYELCLYRNSTRERKVPEDAIKRMYMSWTPPHKYEGWDEIRYVFPDNVQIKDASEWIGSVMDFDQQNSNHQLTLGEHCKTVGQLLQNENMLLELAGLIHDIGKPFTKGFENKKRELTEDAHYYNHQNVGSYESMFYMPGRNPEDIAYVTNLIYYHMHPYISWSKSEKAMRRDSKLLGERMVRDVLKLHEADIVAHAYI